MEENEEGFLRTITNESDLANILANKSLPASPMSQVNVVASPIHAAAANSSQGASSDNTSRESGEEEEEDNEGASHKDSSESDFTSRDKLVRVPVEQEPAQK
jgi:hypothetical protein